MNNARLLFLFRRYMDQLCTQDEKHELMRLINGSSHNEQVKFLMDQLWRESPACAGLSRATREQILDDIFATDRKTIAVQRKRTSFAMRSNVAATVTRHWL